MVQSFIIETPMSLLVVVSIFNPRDSLIVASLNICCCNAIWTLWCPLLPYGHSYKASHARPD